MRIFDNCCFPSIDSDKNFRETHRAHSEHKLKNSNTDLYNTPKSHHKHYSDTLAETPLKVKLIDTLGLKDYLIDMFIFARKKSTYKLQTKNNKSIFKFDSIKFTQIEGYTQICDVIETESSFIPVIHFKKKQTKKHQLAEEYYNFDLVHSELTLIYSHGNSSDLEYCYQIMQVMIRKYPVNFIIYDYTGYGNQCKKQKQMFPQHNHKLSQQSICEDLRNVIKWSKVPYQNIILWGFSLGCYPSIKVATEIQVSNLICQSPFASIFHLIESQQQGEKVFKQDLFNNIELISKINCNALLIHSENDEIIPIRHSRMLLNRFNQSKNRNWMRLIQISNIKHNDMNLVFCLDKKNQLQEQLEKYLINAAKSKEKQKQFKHIESNIKGQNKLKRDLISINSHDKKKDLDLSISRIQFSDNFFEKQHPKNKKNTKDKIFQKQQIENRSTKQNQVSNQNQIWYKNNLKSNGIELNETEFYKKPRNYSFQIQD